MFLLNQILIDSYIKEGDNTLKIDPYVKKHLEHTFYYFTLGDCISLNGEAKMLSAKIGQNHLILKPNDFVLVKTLELFTTNAKIMGMLGSCGSLTSMGLHLLHSPFIDPKFNGHLKFGIKNLGGDTVTLEYGVSQIGKVSFFDISDTYPIKIEKGSSFEQRFPSI